MALLYVKKKKKMRREKLFEYSILILTTILNCVHKIIFLILWNSILFTSDTFILRRSWKEKVYSWENK